MARKKYEPWEAALGLTSFNPLEAMQLQDAIRNREETVLLGSKTFALHYRDDKVHYSPVEGYVPCGWLDIERMEKGF